MIYAGCDLGTAAAKIVLIKNGSVLDYETLPYKNLPRQAAESAYGSVLSRNSLVPEQISYCIATGFGKKAITFADGDAPEIVCLNKAVKRIFPEVKTVIDMGGQVLRAFNISENGKVLDSTTNEKCAAGTGKFIEVMARALELSLDQLGPLPLSSKNPVSITSQCGVFAESEVITYVNEGKDTADIVAGISRSVAAKISSLVRRISLIERVAMVGGVAKNSGVVGYVEEELGIKLVEPEIDPQVIGALGAAIIAEERHGGV